jgi:hypothetical protein
LVNFHFDFGAFVPVNSKKCDAGMRQRPFREVPALGAEIDDRRALGPGRRQTPAELNQLHAIVPAPKNGRGLCRPDIIAGFKIGGGRWKDDRSADLAERREIVAVGDVVSEVVAHGGSIGSCIGSIALVVNDRTVLQLQPRRDLRERQVVVDLA